MDRNGGDSGLCEPLPTGEAVIDDAHRALFDLYERLRDAVEGGGGPGDCQALCTELQSMARRHFAQEEEAMAAAGFPDLETHRRLHAGLMHQLDDLGGFIAVSGTLGTGDDRPTVDFVARYLLLAVVGQWLKVHTTYADQAFAHFLALATPRRTTSGR